MKVALQNLQTENCQIQSIFSIHFSLSRSLSLPTETFLSPKAEKNIRNTSSFNTPQTSSDTLPATDPALAADPPPP